MKSNVCHLILSVLTMEPYASFQGSNREKAFTAGSHHLTPRRTITLHVVLITRKRQDGCLKVASFRSGNQQVPFFGSTENVCPVLFSTWFLLILPCVVAGSGKSVIWFVD